MKTLPTAPGESVVVAGGEPWAAYASFARELGDRPSMRLAYCEGTLEIMPPPLEHQELSRLIDQIVTMMAAVE